MVMCTCYCTADFFCHQLSFQIIVYCREKEEQKFYFPCDQWLAKDEGDGQIVRQLTASTDSSAAFQGN